MCIQIGLGYLTFSGNGEPMLHPEFMEIARAIKTLKEKYQPSVALALLSNSSLVGKNDIAKQHCVRSGFRFLNWIAGMNPLFEPSTARLRDLKISEIVAGLNRLSKRFKITIQTVFIDGVVPNLSSKAVYESGFTAIKNIKPAAIQIYFCRPPGCRR